MSYFYDEELRKDIKTLMNRVVEILSQLKILSLSPAQRMNKKYLDSAETSKILKISERTLFKLREEGSIKFCKIRRKIMYRAEDVFDFIEKNFE